MSSSASEPNGIPSRPLPEPADAELAAAAEDRTLMDRVLRETLAAADADAPLEASEREALLQVARRHGGADLSLQPVTVELVEAVLRTRFRAVSGRGGLWQSLAVRIAETLWEDPTSRGRLQVLWSRLTEAAR